MPIYGYYSDVTLCTAAYLGLCHLAAAFTAELLKHSFEFHSPLTVGFSCWLFSQTVQLFSPTLGQIKIVRNSLPSSLFMLQCRPQAKLSTPTYRSIDSQTVWPSLNINSNSHRFGFAKLCSTLLFHPLNTPTTTNIPFHPHWFPQKPLNTCTHYTQEVALSSSITVRVADTAWTLINTLRDGSSFPSTLLWYTYL